MTLPEDLPLLQIDALETDAELERAMMLLLQRPRLRWRAPLARGAAETFWRVDLRSFGREVQCEE